MPKITYKTPRNSIKPKIVSGTYPPISIDLSNDKPSMTLQREYREGQYLVWRDYKVDGEIVESPIGIEVAAIWTCGAVPCDAN